ncbi:hypothetical protein HPB47_007063 [Ixodes persulcatus]|uniref:Uncharacterized protein n=1 Tax=Ixodes persulcatus TaxID=34615 RepID=A0AC60P8D2_IXOPE|nr:hypothetical protein HPB47_007063 [Ixodes persulcatus]
MRALVMWETAATVGPRRDGSQEAAPSRYPLSVLLSPGTDTYLALAASSSGGRTRCDPTTTTTGTAPTAPHPLHNCASSKASVIIGGPSMDCESPAYRGAKPRPHPHGPRPLPDRLSPMDTLGYHHVGYVGGGAFPRGAGPADGDDSPMLGVCVDSAPEWCTSGALVVAWGLPSGGSCGRRLWDTGTAPSRGRRKPRWRGGGV